VVGYVPDISVEELAARMAVGIANGHPFVDGNKRTACVVSLMFLQLYGVEISAPDDELARIFESVARGETSEVDLAQWFAENTMPPEY
jgi:death on curing protein